MKKGSVNIIWNISFCVTCRKKILQANLNLLLHYSLKLLVKSVCFASFMSACPPIIAKFVAKGNSTNKDKNMCEQPSTQTHTHTHTHTRHTHTHTHTCPAAMNCLEGGFALGPSDFHAVWIRMCVLFTQARVSHRSADWTRCGASVSVKLSERAEEKPPTHVFLLSMSSIRAIYFYSVTGFILSGGDLWTWEVLKEPYHHFDISRAFNLKLTHIIYIFAFSEEY